MFCTCAHDRRALQQLVLNVQVKHSDKSKLQKQIRNLLILIETSIENRQLMTYPLVPRPQTG